MRTREVIYAEAALDDLDRILRWVAETASPVAAIHIVEQLEDYIATLDFATERGQSRDDLVTGLRIVGHGRAVIAVYVQPTIVTVSRVFYGGEDWKAALRRGEGD